MKKRIYFLLLMLFLSAQILKAADSPRMKYNFNSGWKLFVGDNPEAKNANFDDASWKSITLPHAFNEDDAFKKPIDSLTTGISWYRKHFKIPASDAGKKVFLEFEGIRQAAEIYLNGKFIGLYENGVMAFGLDISSEVKTGSVENVIAVRTDNSWSYREKASGKTFQWNDKNFYANYGGISKNVWLHVSENLYQTLPLYSFLKTTGVYIYADRFNIPAKTATVTVESQVKNENSTAKTFVFEVEVKDLDGKTIKTFSASPITLNPGETKTVSAKSDLQNLHFWSWGYGYLYTVFTRLKVAGANVDEVQTKTGFRKTEFKNGMVYLNDRVLMMHGYAQRTTNEWPALGLSVPAWLSDYSNGRMVESNANLVRWMHVTPWKQDVESCDRVGLIQAMPAGDSEKDATGRQWEMRTEVMRDAIIYNRNNPSILFYESGNKGVSEPHMQELKAIRDQYDPNGGRAIGSREMLDSKTAEYGGEMLYINKSSTKPVWSMEYSRDEALRKYWDEYSPPYHKNGDGPLYKNQNASDYNRNQDSQAIEDVIRWFEYWHERPGTGERVSSGGVNIVFSDSNTHFRGAENYRRSGEIDALRIAKDGFYAHQVMWNGWVDPEKTGIHLVGHWNYKPGIQKDIFVIASGDKVELFLNGKSLGLGKQSNHFLFTFNKIDWKAGVLKAVSYDLNGKKLAETQLKTAGKPVAVRLTAIQNPTGFKADGADVALVEAEVVDTEGNRCPIALNMLNFKLNGPAEWRGGLAQGPGNYILSKMLPVEGGVNRVIIRSTTKAGKITVTANSEGLKSASINLNSLPVKEASGLSLNFPADGLKPNLKRGETPIAPSYTISRKSVKIIAAITGVNQDQAKNSFDDNELTDWVNDGKLATATISYKLAQEVSVSEVVLKLNNFRTRSYPIKILVDQKVVFDGETGTDLGYFTAEFTPAKGKMVTIQLQKSSGKNSIGKETMAEVGGKKLDDGIARNDMNAAGTLSIIEAEIYTKP